VPNPAKSPRKWKPPILPLGQVIGQFIKLFVIIVSSCVALNSLATRLVILKKRRNNKLEVV
jgi:hypothetical protein